MTKPNKLIPIITISNMSKPETNAVLARIVIALRAAGLDPVVDHTQRLSFNKYMDAIKNNPPMPDFMEKVAVLVQIYSK